MRPIINAVPLNQKWPENLKAVVFCKDCKYYHEDVWEKIDGIPFIAAHEVCTFWGNGCKTNEKSYCSYGVKTQ